MPGALSFEPGTVVVDDRGYNDYRLFAKWTEEQVYFVTRMKDNALYTVVEERPVPQHRSVVKDQIIFFLAAWPGGNVPIHCVG